MRSIRDVHSSFHCSQPFCSLFRCSWWFLVVPRTRLQFGNRAFCVAGPVAWNSPLDIRSAPTLSTFKKHAQDTSFLTFLHYLIAVSRVRAANIVRRPCSDSSHVTAPYKLSFYYYYYCHTFSYIFFNTDEAFHYVLTTHTVHTYDVTDDLILLADELKNSILYSK